MALHDTQATPEEAPARDGGFTLVEVIWALFLLGIIAMASLGLFIHGRVTVAHLQRQQAAVSVANGAMDAARSVSPGVVNAAGTVGIVKGRSAAAVKTVWDAATALNSADTSDMTTASDPATGLTVSDQWVPVRSTEVVDNVTYTIDTLVGTCYRLRAASTVSQDCVASVATAAKPNYVVTYRVRVVVRWTEGSNPYTYRLSTLVDPSADAKWNTSLNPFAYDDEFSVEVGSGATFHAVVANDTVDYATSTNPVTNLSGTTPSGAGTITTKSGDNNGIYFAPSTKSGLATFTYKVKASSGKTSTDPATVTVHILPKPDNDNIYVPTGKKTDITADMLDGDLGTTNLAPTDRQTTIVPVWSSSVDMFSTENVSDAVKAARIADQQNLADAGISVSSDGKSVKFDAGSSPKTTTFYYYLVDDPAAGSGQRYPSVTLGTVTVTSENAPATKALTAQYSLTSADTWNEIKWLALTTPNPTGTKIKVTGVTGPGSPAALVQIDGKTAGATPGDVLKFNSKATNPGVYVITYALVSPSGKTTSATDTITVTVTPVVPGAFTYGTIFTGNGAFTVDLKNITGLLPTTNIVAISTKTTSTSGACTVTASPSAATISISGLAKNQSCIFSYQIQTTNLNPQLPSNLGQLTVKRGN